MKKIFLYAYDHINFGDDLFIETIANRYPDTEIYFWTNAQNQKVFNEGQRVYYLFIAPKKMNNEFIRVQVFKMTDNAPWGGNEVVRTKDYRLMLDERYYHTNYFTLYEKGRYVMQVFSHDDFQHPLALNDFYVK